MAFHFAARDADVHLYPIAFHPASRQRALSCARHAHLPLVRVGTAARRARDAWLGGALRACQAGKLFLHFFVPRVHGLLCFFPFIQALPRRDDLTPLTDPNFICKALSDMPTEAAQEAGAGTGWRGLGNVVQVTSLQSSS
jgi:hypothetical protein